MPGMEKTMREFKAGKLRSSSGKKVTDRDQAIAIGMNRKEGGKVSKKKSVSSVDPKTGATRGYKPITVETVDPETGATRGMPGSLGDDFTSGRQPVKKARGGMVCRGYGAARQPMKGK